MRKLRICILDLIHNSPSNSLYRRILFPNHLSIMPQVIAVWCREEGRRVSLQKDDAVYLFSDGFTDQLGGENRKRFTTKRLKDQLLEIQDKTMPDQ